MNSADRTFWLVWVLAAGGVLICCGGQREARAQFGPAVSGNQFELSQTVQLDRADSTVLDQLRRVDEYLADRQWDEAIETLREVMDGAENKLKGVTEWRYVSLRDYCHLQLASMPDEPLKLYRSRVDPVARKWYEEGVAKHDRRLLANVVEQAFASSWGDDALLALGEMALESGDYAAARWYWERIVPADCPPGTANTWPGFPDTDLDLAAVRARLVLVSILEGSIDRAQEELAEFARLHPDARGRFGGREENYVEALRALVAEAATWPQREPDPDWPTFAGCAARNKVAAELIDVADVAWRFRLSGPAAGPHPPPSYHPVLVGQLVLVNNRREVFAISSATGKPAFAPAAARVFHDQNGAAENTFGDPANMLGVPRFTMTEFDGRVYARMGSTVTSRPAESVHTIGPGYLVYLDLARQGRLEWKIMPEPGWAFEGTPVADRANVYVGMQRSDIRPQAYVACFDAQTGRRRWRRFICGAETPARALRHQSTHNLLTLQGETLYYNTNLGAIAAVSVGDGQIKWLSLYPRERRGDLANLAPHWRRDLNPCLYHRGTLLVAPADSPRIFALDAATGQVLWQTGTQLEDIVHLLGTTEEHLIASGDRLYWIGLKGEERGRAKHVWPDGGEKLGYGRGLLAGDCVLFPAREKIYVFDRKTARPKKVIDLAARGVTGGNLLVADGRLLIATATELIALKRRPGGPKEDTRPLSSFPRSAWERKSGLRELLSEVPAQSLGTGCTNGSFIARCTKSLLTLFQ